MQRCRCHGSPRHWRRHSTGTLAAAASVPVPGIQAHSHRTCPTARRGGRSCAPARCAVHRHPFPSAAPDRRGCAAGCVRLLPGKGSARDSTPRSGCCPAPRPLLISPPRSVATPRPRRTRWRGPHGSAAGRGSLAASTAAPVSTDRRPHARRRQPVPWFRCAPISESSEASCCRDPPRCPALAARPPSGERAPALLLAMIMRICGTRPRWKPSELSVTPPRVGCFTAIPAPGSCSNRSCLCSSDWGTSASRRIDAAKDGWRTFVQAHVGAHARVPRISGTGTRPFGGVRHAGVFELVDCQVFRLAFDGEIAARTDAAGHRQIPWDVVGVVPVVEFLLHGGGDIDASHLKEWRWTHRVVDRIGLHREDLAVAIQQVVAADESAGCLRSPGRRLIAHGVKERRTAQHVMVFQFIHRQVLGAAAQRDVAAGAKEAGNRQQAADMFFVVPAIKFVFVDRVDVHPGHQQSGAARLRHDRSSLAQSMLLDRWNACQPSWGVDEQEAIKWTRSFTECTQSFTEKRSWRFAQGPFKEVTAPGIKPTDAYNKLLRETLCALRDTLCPLDYTATRVRLSPKDGIRRRAHSLLCTSRHWAIQAIGPPFPANRQRRPERMTETARFARTTSQKTEHFDVVIVGAGISGVGGAYHLTRQCPGTTFVVLETQGSFGGTWLTHRYPGIRSDSDLYTFGYRFKPWISAPIATAAEILSYMREVIDENGLGPHIRYRHKIASASWSSSENLWTIEATRTDTGEAVRFT